MTGRTKVVDQNLGNTEVQSELGGYLSDGHRLRAQEDNRLKLRHKIGHGGRSA